MPTVISSKTDGVRTDKPECVVGLVRFSLVLRKANYFPQMKQMSFSERVEHVYDRTRLERRFELFESICLPSLKNQTNQQFNIAILTSKFLPDWAMERLLDGLQGTDNIYVRPFRANANYMNLARRAVYELLDHGAKTYASFNLDDDDALANDYVERLRSYIIPENSGKAVTFRYGCELTVAGGDLRLKYDKRPKASAGLAGINAGPISDVADVFSIFEYGGHRKVDERVPLITDNSQDMYLQSANGINVSLREGLSDASEIMEASEIVERLSGKYPYLTESMIEKINQVS